ncbi:MAG: hypothetical protein ACRYF2_13735 [Janthinobacterium lividum]
MPDPAVVAAQASKLLSGAIIVQVDVLAYADRFGAAALGAFGCPIPVALMHREPPSVF